jgi:DNA repair protein RecN (Recombination protein N)
MLRSLAIRDLAVIDRLDLAFVPGLTVLTGETGAGKSILLDALGLACGERGDANLIRPGAEAASVAAGFDVAGTHPAAALLAEQGFPMEDGSLVLRRVLGNDGRSRAFVNDQPASVALLRQLGSLLVEVEGQFAEQGLLDARNHRAMLDSFGELDALLAETGAAHRHWRAAQTAYEDARRTLVEAKEREAQLREELTEIEALDPKPGEETSLAELRTTMMHREQLLEAMNAAQAALAQGGAAGRSVADALHAALRALGHVADKAPGKLEEILAGLDRAAVEVAEAESRIHATGAALDHDSRRLETVEERLFALKALARKHGVTVDGLSALRERMSEQLAAAEGRGGGVGRLKEAAAAARAAFQKAATALSEARKEAAAALDRAVTAELRPLKLERTRFETRLTPLAEDAWGETGAERVSFEVATNPGAPPGPIERIASGGELARFLLALKVAAAGGASAATLIFDEVDRGIGGAVASAVGERLARLGGELQVLVVTHSPQVAAKGRHHIRIAKRETRKGGAAAVSVAAEELSGAARREEIARMLSGAEITDEARAAAARLLEATAGKSRTARETA